jgi:hypothetical protein
MVLCYCPVCVCGCVRMSERERELEGAAQARPPARSHTRNVIIIKYPPALAAWFSLLGADQYIHTQRERAESNSACAFRSLAAVPTCKCEIIISRRAHSNMCDDSGVSARSFVACVAFIGKQSVRAQ